MINKLNQLARKKYILFGIPLLCGAIIGIVVTLSIPHVKADVAVVSNNGSTSNQAIDTSGATQATVVTQPPQSAQTTQAPVPTSPSSPISVPAQQTNNSAPTQGVSQPCH